MFVVDSENTTHSEESCFRDARIHKPALRAVWDRNQSEETFLVYPSTLWSSQTRFRPAARENVNITPTFSRGSGEKLRKLHGESGRRTAQEYWLRSNALQRILELRRFKSSWNIPVLCKRCSRILSRDGSEDLEGNRLLWDEMTCSARIAGRILFLCTSYAKLAVQWNPFASLRTNKYEVTNKMRSIPTPVHWPATYTLRLFLCVSSSI